MYLHDIVHAIDCPAIDCPGSYNSVSSLIYILGEAGTVQCRRGAYMHIEVKLFVLGALAELEHNVRADFDYQAAAEAPLLPEEAG